jgi:hypothetical protein
MTVRAYDDERWTPPPPQGTVSAPADNTRYVNPTPSQRLIPDDTTHNNALRNIATATIAAAVPAAALGPANAVRAGVAAAGVTVATTCVMCHTTKK